MPEKKWGFREAPLALREGANKISQCQKNPLKADSSVNSCEKLKITGLPEISSIPKESAMRILFRSLR
ncbi:MAG: hypothetical protein NC254_05360 [bacterium]|nr:hypothetical protein [bacterium]